MKKEKEIWTDTYYFGDAYEISSYGVVRNKKTKKIKKSHINKLGYYRIVLVSKGKRVTINLHRLVYLSFNPNTPKDFDVHHIDHIKTNNHLSNLGAIDKRSHCSLHTKYSIAAGTWALKNSPYHKRGKDHPRHKYDIAAICLETNIIKNIFSGHTDLKNHGLSHGAVWQVLMGKRKKHKNLFFKKVDSTFTYKIGDTYPEQLICK
jgi:hypothetical protein